MWCDVTFTFIKIQFPANILLKTSLIYDFDVCKPMAALVTQANPNSVNVQIIINVKSTAQLSFPCTF